MADMSSEFRSTGVDDALLQYYTASNTLKALHARSLRDQAGVVKAHYIQAPNSPASTQVPQGPKSSRFYPITEIDADTLIYIGTPPRQPAQSDYDYKHIRQYFERPYLMRSSTLRSQNSAKFERLLDSLSSKTKRKLTEIGILDETTNPNGIEYYLDLSPPIDGDEAACLVADLSVPCGVLDWSDEAKAFGVSPVLVSGTDDLDIPPRPCHIFDDSTEDTQQATSSATMKDNSYCKTPQDRAELVVVPGQVDYSPLRHHRAIEQLLQAIAGRDPELDSAAKVWTYCMVAKAFGCAVHPSISSWVVSWLLADGNNNFIQCHPQATYAMASAMQLSSLLRCSYAILVGRKAMALVGANSSPVSPQRLRAVHNAGLADLRNENDIKSINHAAQSFHNRIRTKLRTLTGPNTPLVSDTLFNQLAGGPFVGDTAVQTRLNDVCANLVLYCRRRVLSALCDELTLQTVDGSAYRSTLTTELINSYNNLDVGLRVFTPHLWTHVRAKGLAPARPYSSESEEILEKSWLKDQETLKIGRMMSKDDTIPLVSEAHLERELDWCRRATGWTTAEASTPLALSALLHEINERLRDICQTEILTPGFVADETCDINVPIHKVSTLLCLDKAEWKYLPLWAGGCDDGTGGVFDDERTSQPC